MTNGLQSVSRTSCVLDEKLSRAIEELERSGRLDHELAEFRSIATNYGGATAIMAAEVLVEFWRESSEQKFQDQ